MEELKIGDVFYVVLKAEWSKRAQAYRLPRIDKAYVRTIIINEHGTSYVVTDDKDQSTEYADSSPFYSWFTSPSSAYGLYLQELRKYIEEAKKEAKKVLRVENSSLDEGLR